MQERSKSNMTRRIVDVCMTVLLLFLMAYQVTGEVVHEWIGIAMTVLVIIHQILNRRWYKAIFRGKYNPYRILTTAVNLLLLLSFLITALSGMSMSGHAVPFMYGMAPASLSRKMHLAMSHWSFVLMGLHLGLHIPAMTAGMKADDRKKTLIAGVFACVAGIGLFLFLRNGIADYMFFRAAFAFLDYEKAGGLVLIENILMLLFWAFIGDQTALLCRKAVRRNAETDESGIQYADSNRRLLPLLFIMAALIIGLVLNTAFPSPNKGFGSGEAGLTPAYNITSDSVSWDMSADGYRLPTEAEWEYACRAGTNTPFNTEESLDASEANFYGHYPYEIEENYFDSSGLEAQPGEYRQSTVNVGSFEPNKWGLYDCHGNVNEWCWDYYGDYDTGEGLSVHYSGGSELPNDVSEWLSKNGIQ